MASSSPSKFVTISFSGLLASSIHAHRSTLHSMLLHGMESESYSSYFLRANIKTISYIATYHTSIAWRNSFSSAASRKIISTLRFSAFWLRNRKRPGFLSLISWFSVNAGMLVTTHSDPQYVSLSMNLLIPDGISRSTIIGILRVNLWDIFMAYMTDVVTISSLVCNFSGICFEADACIS